MSRQPQPLTERLAHALRELSELVKAAHFDREAGSFSADVFGGFRVTVQRTGEPARPSLPPPPAARVYDTTAEEITSVGPGIRKCAEVIRIHDRRKRSGSAA